MKALKTVLAICGSTRTRSTNLNLIKAIAALAKDTFDTTIYEGLDAIPHFNPDLDTDDPPAAVTVFRNTLHSFDGLLICTPEYAMGVPGTLKNAIDWTVSSMEFSNKPVALITASSVGQKGHAALLETLKVIEARMTDDTRLLISFAKTKISEEGKVTDEKTLREVERLIEGFDLLLRQPH
jgi:NAD(P)H-dependent FMN reductase